jgi:hypothetical protein
MPDDMGWPSRAWFFTPFQERYYQRRLAAADGRSVPEARMGSALVGTFLLPLGLVRGSLSMPCSYYELMLMLSLVHRGVDKLSMDSVHCTVDRRSDIRLRVLVRWQTSADKMRADLHFSQIIYSILNYVVDGYGHYSASALYVLSYCLYTTGALTCPFAVLASYLYEISLVRRLAVYASNQKLI